MPAESHLPEPVASLERPEPLRPPELLLFPIGELTRRTGTTKRVVEHAESRGLLQPAGRTPLGYKLYGPHQEARLRLIKRLYELGFSASRVKALFLEAPDRVETLLDDHAAYLERRATEARRQASRFARERAALAAQLEAQRATERYPFASTNHGPGRVSDDRPEAAGAPFTVPAIHPAARPAA